MIVSHARRTLALLLAVAAFVGFVNCAGIDMCDGPACEVQQP